jgi:nitrite reductase/ring-hydroxylating ferredoxin subunit
MRRFVRVAEEGDVQPGKVKGVRLADRKIALFNEDGVVRAYEDYCTHTGGPLTQGSCEGGVVTCLWHGAQFRISDGAPLTPPAGGRLRAYAVRVAHGEIEVEIED